MQTITLTAPDISCEHCQRTIERELATVPGVEAVAVDIPSKAVRVTDDLDEASEKEIAARLEEEGYAVARGS